MSLTYEESAALMTNPTFRGRIKVACLTYAQYILGEAPGNPGHSSRVRWAQQTFLGPEQAATSIQPPVVMYGAVQEAGSNIADAALQAAVESTVNQIL